MIGLIGFLNVHIIIIIIYLWILYTACIVYAGTIHRYYESRRRAIANLDVWKEANPRLPKESKIESSILDLYIYFHAVARIIIYVHACMVPGMYV